MKCILICAGYATRLFPLTKNFPKALIEVGERPILDYILDKVNELDEVDSIYVVTNNKYYNHFVDWNESKNNIKPIKILNDHTMSNDDRLGAIGDIWYTIEQEDINDDILVIAGDNLFDYSLTGVIDYYKEKKGAVVCTKVCKDINLLKAFAVATVDEDNKILELEEKPENPKSNIAVYATYVYPKSVIKLIKEYLEEGNKPDAPGYLVQYLYKKMDVYTYNFIGNCFDVGTHESLKEVNKLYKKKD